MKLNDKSGFFTPFLRKQRLQIISNYLKRVRYKKVYDYGCGQAHILQYLKNVNYTGYDIQKKLIYDNKKKFPKKKFITKLSNEKFDVIILSAVIEHVPNPLQLLKKLKKKFIK